MNPQLRVCITTMEYLDGKQNKGGPTFTPRIFDSENLNDAHYSLVTVGRATSAAPTYFRPVVLPEETKEGKTVQKMFIDGGVFCNNPAGWGFVLAGTKVKGENVRIVSVGTGEAEIKEVDVEKGNIRKALD